MQSLHQRLSDLMNSRRDSLITEDEYTEMKKEMLKDTTIVHGVQKSEQKKTRAMDSTASGVTHGEDVDDVFPLPFPCKTGASSREDIEEQDYYNREMLEIYKTHHGLCLTERKSEATRRYALRQRIRSLKEEVKSAVNWASKLLHTREKRITVSNNSIVTPMVISRRGGRQSNTPNTASNFTEESLRHLLFLCEDISSIITKEHGKIITTVIPALPVELIDRESNISLSSRGLFEKKPHLFNILKTAEVATVDSHWIGQLHSMIAISVYLCKKLKWCIRVIFSEVVPPTSGTQNLPISGSTKVTPNPAINLAWKKFVRSAKNEFSESELRLISEETLHTLLSHFGKHMTATECYWVTLKLRNFQNQDPGSSPRRHKSITSPAPLISDTAYAPIVCSAAVQENIRAVQEEICERASTSQATDRVRSDYESVLVEILKENAKLILERNTTDNQLVEELVKNVQEECNASFTEQKKELQQQLDNCASTSQELRRGLQKRIQEVDQSVAERVTIAEQAAKNELNKSFQKEFAEVRSLRQYYEDQIQVLKGQVTLCSEQNDRLKTELNSGSTTRMVEDLKKKISSEHEVTISELKATIASQEAQLVSQEVANKKAADLLYQECIAEARRTAELANQRGSLVTEIDVVQKKVLASRSVSAATYVLI